MKNYIQFINENSNCKWKIGNIYGEEYGIYLGKEKEIGQSGNIYYFLMVLEEPTFTKCYTEPKFAHSYWYDNNMTIEEYLQQHTEKINEIFFVLKKGKDGHDNGHYNDSEIFNNLRFNMLNRLNTNTEIIELMNASDLGLFYKE